MKLLKAADVVVLIFVSIGAIVVSVAHLLDLFPSIDALVHLNYPLLAVLLLALIGIHLGLAHFASERFHEQTGTRLNDIHGLIGHSLVRVFADAVELEKYLAKRIREAKIEVCDLSWKKRISVGFALGKRKRSHRDYEWSIATSTKAILYREIFVFNDPRRVDKLKRRVEEARDGYSCRHYDEDGAIPRSQFVIIDNREIVFFAVSPHSPLCAIESPELCSVFKPYFEEAWNGAIPIKDGPVLHQVEYKRILAGQTTLGRRLGS